MAYILFLMLFCLIGGFVGVASNPSPYFGAAGLVLSAAAGCGVLMGFGCSFVSLVLFLIYLGGMLVVFAYSVALASEPFPESWGNWSVLVYLSGYVVLVTILWIMYGEGWVLSSYGVIGDNYVGLSVVRGDLVGVSLLYSFGGGGLLVCGWGLLLTLFVVLELTRGLSRGGLRAV
uniref:NADH-ubiquinone oxidoreductase chain 6 n=2 Tax=Liolaemus TaxID=43599 RepID=A0A890A235_9SAUR|nr:NADH dehydrogenase subunit 6 [Liolaemus darwinii]YP_010157263.1 NADH dehydrogenase subunit 6 [Liolaemus parthenos]QRG01372.1 NADH dehydrogenase subunit 6 [Liolaemus darwinii]QRG01398.1 NADH dehydrogenase subunit 6 [Liolaemus parthenos]